MGDVLARLSTGFDLTALADGSAVLVDPATLEAVVVSEVGRRILERVREGVVDLDRIAEGIAGDYDVSVSDARRDAESFLADLDRRLAGAVTG